MTKKTPKNTKISRKSPKNKKTDANKDALPVHFRHFFIKHAPVEQLKPKYFTKKTPKNIQKSEKKQQKTIKRYKKKLKKFERRTKISKNARQKNIHLKIP